MTNLLFDTIKYIKNTNNVESKEEMEILLKENYKYIDMIITAAKNNGWVFFSKNTYDGWYCTKKDKGNEYVIFYQEKGIVNQSESIELEEYPKAIVLVLVYSGYFDAEIIN